MRTISIFQLIAAVGYAVLGGLAFLGVLSVIVLFDHNTTTIYNFDLRSGLICFAGAALGAFTAAIWTGFSILVGRMFFILTILFFLRMAAELSMSRLEGGAWELVGVTGIFLFVTALVYFPAFVRQVIAPETAPPA